ncbi:MAG: type II toxin-antitoxin system RelB/DinJ family antitoxin [Leptolyngbya sp.]|nr:type II toxin-antitoxin system RelB/DinJ family antitoxin [Candidatus Melainabacteria bacterium]
MSKIDKHEKQDDVIRARISKKVKSEASAVLASIGLTPSSAYRMMMMKIAAEKALPFDPLIPNEKTVAAIMSARKGELSSASSVSDLFDQMKDVSQ